MTNNGDRMLNLHECLSALPNQRSRFNLLTRWTADGISILFPSSYREFQYYTTHDHEIVETIGRFILPTDMDSCRDFDTLPIESS